mgnify:CR=1 FL=1
MRPLCPARVRMPVYFAERMFLLITGIDISIVF